VFRKKGKVSGDGICHNEGPVRTRPCDVAFQSPGTGIEVRDERSTEISFGNGSIDMESHISPSSNSRTKNKLLTSPTTNILNRSYGSVASCSW
jgi:hypothetical protein